MIAVTGRDVFWVLAYFPLLFLIIIGWSYMTRRAEAREEERKQKQREEREAQ